MLLQHETNFQGKYRLKSTMPDTGEVCSTGWSLNKLYKTANAAKIINSTGIGPKPNFMLGYNLNETGGLGNNAVALVVNTFQLTPTTHGWVDPADPTKGYWIKGGGWYKCMPNTTVAGYHANLVSVENFSSAFIADDKGVEMLYPVVPGVPIEVEFELKMTITTNQTTQLPMTDQFENVLGNIGCRANIAINLVELTESGYDWWRLASMPKPMIALPTVAGSIADVETLKNIELGTKRWESNRHGVIGTQGDYYRRTGLYSAMINQSFIRLGISSGVPGVYVSLIFDQPYVFEKDYYFDIINEVVHSEKWSS